MKLELNPQPVQSLFLTAEEKIVFFGGGAGGGKSWAILADNLAGVHDPDYHSVFFRTTTVELETNLWPEALKMYEPLLRDEDGNWIGKSHINFQKKIITFPSGAVSRFTYLDYDKDADQHYGAEYTKIYFDETQKFSDYHFQVLRSRNRSRAKVQKGIRCTLNPDPNHFVFDWVKPFLDEEGYPIKSLAGKTRYFVILDGKLHTDWDKKALSKLTGKNPQTYTYIPATLSDNKVLMEIDPEYIDTLDSLPEAKRKQLLEGCWYSGDSNGMYFKRQWLQKAIKLPKNCYTVRGYDLAASEPTESYPYPDFTASIKMSKSSDGYYYITGDYVDEFMDPDLQEYGRFRKRSGDRDNIMLKQAEYDTKKVRIVLPEDSGAAGKDAFRTKVKFFQKNGFIVKKDLVNRTANKVTKFEPFATACEHGLVYIIESTFDKNSLESFYRELEAFNGERSTSKRKDD